MQCPICKDQTLHAKQVEDGLNAFQCGKCAGRWIGSFHYWKWKDASGKTISDDSTASDNKLPVNDNKSAKLCPECGSFLRHFPVGHGVEFGLDRCGNCGGMWFDENEWESLKREKLCEDTHKIFSQIWQNQVRSDQHQSALKDLHIEKFGQADYNKILDVKEWISNHPLQSELRAFLGS